MKKIIIAIFLLNFSLSCTSTKNIKYFTDVPDSLKSSFSVPLAEFTEPKIRCNDILYVSIQTIDPQVNLAIGSSVTSNSSNISSQNQTVSGFLVNQEGKVELPLVGSIVVAGLTTTQVKELIKTKVSLYYKDPVVNIRFANFTITVLGEVAKPGTYTISNERINLLDAIGMSGDLTIFGKRENILLIREDGVQRKLVRFDLKSSNIFRSPYFYLKQGDIIYVEPNKAKVAYNDQAQVRNITIASTFLTSFALIISRINIK